MISMSGQAKQAYQSDWLSEISHLTERKKECKFQQPEIKKLGNSKNFY